MNFNRKFEWCLVLFIALISILSRLKFNGLILNFDYGIYQPDGSHYAYRTLLFLGIDPNVAAERVVDWYQIKGFKNNVFETSFLTSNHSETWGLVAPRILYSMLSVPFVFLFGLSGMLVIPCISFVVLIICVYRMSELYKKPKIGMLLVIFLCTAPTILRWMIANITDSLLTGLFGIVALILMSNLLKEKWSLFVYTLVFLTSITRFCTLIWIAIAVVQWSESKHKRSLGILVVSIISSIPILYYMPSNAVLPENAGSSGISKLLVLIESFFKVGFFEIAQLAVLDRMLLIVIILATAIAFRYPKDLSSKYFLLVFLAVWSTGAINGTVGVNFRYQLPAVAFACWRILSVSNDSFDWFGRRRFNIK